MLSRAASAARFFVKVQKYLKNYKNPLEKLRKILYNIE